MVETKERERGKGIEGGIGIISEKGGSDNTRSQLPWGLAINDP